MDWPQLFFVSKATEMYRLFPRSVTSTAPPRLMQRLGSLPHRLQHPLHIRNLFYLCGVFVVLPFFDIPFIDLSITAPLMVPLFYYALLQPTTPWVQRYRSWVLIATAIWLGMVISFVANGSWFAQREMQAVEFAYLVRYFYWLLVFIVTTYIASDLGIQRRLTTILAAAVVVLAGLRCFEGFVFGKVGAESSTVFTRQNYYGILFSTFTPFLFSVFLRRGILRKALCLAGLLPILYACAINGSRGSWVCIGLGLSVFVFLATVSRPSTSMRLILPFGLCVVVLMAIFAGSPSTREVVLDRFSTFDDLDKDKSYMTRWLMNQKSLKLFQQYPKCGVGPGRYQSVYVPLDLPQVLAHRSEDSFMRKSSHNSYLSYLAENGLVGALPLAILIGVLAVLGAYAAAVLNRKGEHWALGVYASFIGMSLHFWVLSGLTGTHAWFVYGLLAATVVLAARVRKKRSATVVRPQVVRHRLSFASGVSHPHSAAPSSGVSSQ